jgi:hypothetical protein
MQSRPKAAATTEKSSERAEAIISMSVPPPQKSIPMI